jgi:hypothetical protein
VTGGIGTILVVLVVAWLWPEMRKIGMKVLTRIARIVTD